MATTERKICANTLAQSWMWKMKLETRSIRRYMLMTRTPIERFQTNDSSVYFELRRSTSDYYFWLGSFHNIFLRRFFLHFVNHSWPPNLLRFLSHAHATQYEVREIVVRSILNYNTLVNIDLAFLPITGFPITLHFSLLFSSSTFFFFIQPNKRKTWPCASSLSSWKKNELNLLTTYYLVVSIHCEPNGFNKRFPFASFVFFSVCIWISTWIDSIDVLIHKLRAHWGCCSSEI